MKTRDAPQLVEERRQRLLSGLADLVPGMQQRALMLDRSGGFPEEDFDLLRSLGALAAPVPAAVGGLGMGTEPEGAPALMQALRLLGRGNLSVARLYEAHVNVLHLVIRYGNDTQARAVADDALDGRVFGLWVTDAPDAPLRLTEDRRLRGAKAPCSGAGRMVRALVTVGLPSGQPQMAVVRLTQHERVDAACWDAHGMRAALGGRVEWDGTPIGTEALVGEPGDYLRQPDFSTGAWRASAVALGGLDALVAALRTQLLARGRDQDPHQRTRVGTALIAQETARFWVRRAAELGESDEAQPGDRANTVNLGRIAVETACLDVIRIAQRALGLAAFRSGELTELLFRDLAVYLRQPAPDETLTEAAAYFMERDLPGQPPWG